MDCALWDVWSKNKGQPLHKLLPQNEPSRSAFTISGRPETIKKALEKGEWPIYKVKLGGQHDEAIIKILNDFSQTVEIRIDANGGWTADQAARFIPRLIDLGITFIEQPLPPDQNELMLDLHRFEGAQYWADESAQENASLDHLATYFHGINFKLMKSGGISPVLQQIRAARSVGLAIGLGCMTETSFGISALAQIAGLADQLDMDGNLLLASDPARGAYIDAGRVVLPQSNGLGCSWRIDPRTLHP
jgi:L-alanine-DL-glutamate epimerase-like enolase superfamily enzyme